MKNGKNTPLNAGGFGLPDVSNALNNWFQAITFIKIQKEVVNYKLVEMETPLSFRGVLQPMRPQEINWKPAVQRAWKWKTLHIDSNDGVELNVEDVVMYNSTRFRVDSKADFSSYGYIKYDLVEDYEA